MSAAPLDPADAADLAGMYDRIRQRESNSSAGVPLVAETVQLGSDREDGVRSLRVLSRAYVEIDLTQGKKLDYRVIPYVDYAARIRGYAEDLLEAAGMKRFGSGWSWLIVKPDRSVAIVSTPNQDNPLMEGKHAILGVDVWEHAYYLHYQNRRADYLAAFWNVVNWAEVAKRYDTK